MAADHFVAGQLVDVAGHTQGKGFAGAMKRWGLRRYARHPRLCRSATVRMVRPVTVRNPGRVFKNKKMAGPHG
ncbi:50S ribosomal protein L3 [Sphingobium yanoikuyae]|uniref:50S ribosomal protein L3 n=1 Tax=Sphingobium yanoikuyae TaxID=13690 RepID=UPI00345E678A